MNLRFATIVSPNYLAYARVLGESVARHAAGARLQVLVVGRDDPAIRSDCEAAGLSVTFATELGLPDFDELAYKFDIVELNTALKPTFLKRLFAKGAEAVVYLDPDISLYQPPEPVTDALSNAEIVLIPHSLAPIMDGERPSDIDFMRTGAYNLGFIGLRRGPESAALLDWWEARCLALGFNDPGFGTFVDQKWLDLAPSYFDSVHILKHEGCNVAYWNLHERRVERNAEGWRVAGKPLVFFHFSGVDARAPHLLSRHQSRHVSIANSPLAELVADYCARLNSAGHARYAPLPYPFGRLADGSAISPLMRRAATLPDLDRSRPFEPDSALQRSVRVAGLSGSRTDPGKSATTLNFDPNDRKVLAVNFVIRVLARIIGPERVGALVRYATFLGWGGNLGAVLLKQPFQLRHVDLRKDGNP